MKKVLLIAPPYGNLYGGANIRRLKWGFIPYGLASIGGKLRADGHHVRIVDATCQLKNLNDIEKIIREELPDYLGIGMTTPQFTVGLKICEKTKNIKPDCVIVVGGPHPSALPQEMVSDRNVDIAVIGEGETAMSRVVKGDDLAGIKGICYKRDGAIIKNPPQDPIEDLDSLPFPLYEQLPVERYGTPYMGRSVGIITGRGCPFSCSFCASRSIFGRRCRTRSVSSILDEIAWFKARYNITTFSFWDDTFTMRKDRVEDLCNRLIEKEFNITWSCTTRVDEVYPELLKLMKRAGCSVIHLGIESGDELVLKHTQKGITLKQAEKAVELAKSAGIETYGYFILGLPYETEETIKRTIEFAKKIKLDYAQFALLTPLPGTEVWDLAKEGKVLKFVTDNFSRFTRYGKAVIELPGLSTEQLNRYYQKAYFSFYFRWDYILQVLGKIDSPRAFIKYSKMFLGFLNFIF